MATVSKSFNKTPPAPDALHKAVNYGDVTAVKDLLRKGADIDGENSGWVSTPLIIAAYRGYVGILRLLLESGALPDKLDKVGSCALRTAAQKGHLEGMELLLEKGASINQKSRNGQTALMIAVIYQQIEAVRFLIRKGAMLGEKNNRGTTALMIAEENERKEIAQILREAAAFRKEKKLLMAVVLQRNLPYKKSPFKKMRVKK